MIFIMIESDKLETFEKQFNLTKIESSFVNPDYNIISVSGRPYSIFNFIANYKLKALFLPSFLSKKIYDKEFGEANQYLDVVEYEEENLVDKAIQNDFNFNDELYYNLNKKKPTHLKEINEFNKLLKEQNLLLDKNKLLLTLRDFFVMAIENCIRKEKEYEYYTIESINTQNKNFHNSVVAEFILLADNYYSTEDIERFIEELKNELYNGD